MTVQELRDAIKDIPNDWIVYVDIVGLDGVERLMPDELMFKLPKKATDDD